MSYAVILYLVKFKLINPLTAAGLDIVILLVCKTKINM